MIPVASALTQLLAMPIERRDAIVASVEAETGLDLRSKDVPRAWLGHLQCAIPNYDERCRLLGRHFQANPGNRRAG